MKNIYITLTFFFLFTNVYIFGQTAEESINEFIEKTSANVSINKKSGGISFIKFPLENPLKVSGNTLKEKSITFLEENKSIYSLKSIENNLSYSNTRTDNYGLKNVTFDQFYRGVPVFDGKLKFHFTKTSKIAAINGNCLPNIKLNEVPSLAKSEVNVIALKTIEEQNSNYSVKDLEIISSELYVFMKGLFQGTSGTYHLVYEIEVSNNFDIREYVFIDAHNGSVVEQFTGIAHSIDRILYEGNTSNTVWSEGDAFPGGLDQWQQNEVATSGHVYNFFKNAFGYISYDGNDAQMRTINNNPGISCPNANWNGTTVNYCTGTASDDVVAHEWGHAYTEYTSDLIYAYESGALNESFSDIWGETIDLLNNYEDEGEDLSLRTGCNSSDRWKMGEDASAFGGAIRDMWDPTCQNDPGSVSDNQFRCGPVDSGGVHSNSGIPNHVYALLVDGGNYNGQTINAIGFTKAAHIFWRVQSVYLTKSSDFAVFADALEAACADLVGINLEGLSTTSTPAGFSEQIISTTDCEEVTKVIEAVGIKTVDPIDICGYERLLVPIDPLCEASSSNPIFHEDWESGLGDWNLTSKPSNPDTWESRDWVIVSNLPGGRTGQGAFGVDPINGDCVQDLQNGVIRLESPIITMPDVSTGIFELTFDHNIATENLWDGGNIQYRLNNTGGWSLVPGSSFTSNPYNAVLNNLANNGNDNPIAGQEAFTGADEGSNTGSWGKSTIDLTSLGVVANSSIELRWIMGTDGCNGNEGWYIDDVIVYNCSNVLSVSKFDLLLEDISVYPNPTTNSFTIRKLVSLNLIKAEVFDINGRKLKESNLSEMNISKDIDINNLAAGIYFVTVTSDDAKATVKLIKQ